MSSSKLFASISVASRGTSSNTAAVEHQEHWGGKKKEEEEKEEEAELQEEKSGAGVLYELSPDTVSLQREAMADWSDRLSKICDALGGLEAAGRGRDDLEGDLSRRLSVGPDLFNRQASIPRHVTARRRSDQAQLAQARRLASGPMLTPNSLAPSVISTKTPQPAEEERVEEIEEAALLSSSFLPSSQSPIKTVSLAQEKLSLASSDANRRFVYEGACLRATAGAHDGAVNCVCALSGGLIATGGEDMLVKVWNALSGKLEMTCTGHTDSVFCIACVRAPSRPELIASGSDRSVILWNAETGARLRTLAGHRSFVWTLAYVPAERGRSYLATGSADNLIRLWNVDANDRYSFGECIDTVEGHRDSVYCLAVFADGRLASGSTDTTIVIWRPLLQRMVHILDGHTGIVYDLCVVGPSALASASTDKTVRVWDTKHGTCLRELNRHTGPVVCLAANSVGIVLSGSDDGSVIVWDISRGAKMCTLPGHRDGVSSLALLAESHGRGVLAVGSTDGTLSIWGLVGRGT
eukprot:UC1_evm1s371